jgi:non-heme chloroperoxidase
MMGGAKPHYDGIKAFSETDFTQDLKIIDVPTLVIHGTDDQIVPVDHSRELVARLRGAGAVVEYMEVAGADHVWRGAPSVPDIVTASLAFLATTR